MLAVVTVAAARDRERRRQKRLQVQQRSQRRLTEGHRRALERRRREKAKQRRPEAWQVWALQSKRRRLALPGWQVLTARMDPARWYTRRELYGVAPEYAETSIEAWLIQRLLRRGLVDRAPNPDFDPGVAAGAQTEPRWLYRLSASGVKAATEWRESLGEG